MQRLQFVSLFSLILLILLGGCSDNSTFFDKEINQHSAPEVKVYNLVNEHRISIGLPPLELSNIISEAARQHSEDMATGNTPFGHDGFSERVAKIRDQIGGNGAAENVAMGYGSPQSAVKGWLQSSGHKKNIEGNYTHTGIGYATSKNGTPYYTQIFLRK